MTSPVTLAQRVQIPDFWTIWGHSYVQISSGTLWQTGRFDSLFRAALDIEWTNVRSMGINGSCLVKNVDNQGGYNRVQQQFAPARAAAPWVSDSGAHLMCWGINDVGTAGVGAQTRAAWKHNLRGVISRVRASAVFEDTDASISYGAGFVSNTPTNDFSSGSSTRHATALTNANFTITIPATYSGEVICLSFVAQAGAFGGTVTFSGTAGATGTLSTTSQGATLNNGMVVKRFTAPVTGATQTVIGTLTQLDAGGDFHFDCWWLEAKCPPPVLVCNIAKLTAAGYALYSATWTGPDSTRNADVDNFNADLASVVAEFDSMVQIVDLNAALNQDVNLFGDGLHPNELGAAKCAQATLDAMQRLVPVSYPTATSTYAGPVANFNTSSPRGGAWRRPRSGGLRYAPDAAGGLAGTAYTAVAGDMFSMPFYVTSAREVWIEFGIEATASVTGTAIRWGIYDDRAEVGFPQDLVVELTSAAAFTITTGAGLKSSPASGGGSLVYKPDPGLYWLSVKFTTIGVAHTFRTLKGPSDLMVNCAQTTTPGTLNPCGWKLTGQGTTALPTSHVGSAFATAALSDNVPAIFVKLF